MERIHGPLVLVTLALYIPKLIPPFVGVRLGYLCHIISFFITILAHALNGESIHFLNV